MPTSFKVKKCLLPLITARDGGVLFELGSGWGTLAFPVAKSCSTATVLAYESSLFPYFFSRFCLLLFPRNNLQFFRKDFFEISLREATTVVCYLYPGAMEKLKHKFEQELGDHTRVISHTFAIPGWRASEEYEVDDLYRTKIYIYDMNQIKEK